MHAIAATLLPFFILAIAVYIGLAILANKWRGARPLQKGYNDLIHSLLRMTWRCTRATAHFLYHGELRQGALHMSAPPEIPFEDGP